MKKIGHWVFFLVLCINMSCNAQSDEEKINSTVHSALTAINAKDYLKMKELMGIYSPSDTSIDLIVGKVNRVDYLIDKYHDGNVAGLQIQYANELDDLDRQKITVHLFTGNDTATGILEAALYLYVGPPTAVPLTKLSGFEYDEKFDRQRVRKLNQEGKLPDMDTPIKHRQGD